MSSCNNKNTRVVLSDRALEQVMRDLFSMTGCRPKYDSKDDCEGAERPTELSSEKTN